MSQGEVTVSDNRIELIHVLAPEEYSEIDRFCAEHQGEASLPACAAFLDERFSLALVLDHDAYEGFVSDSSNLPGRASALCRPCTIREGAIVLRACYTGRIPVTISAGRSNLTGSATPEGGVIVSTVKMTGEPLVNSAHRTVYAEVGTIVEDLRREVRGIDRQRHP